MNTLNILSNINATDLTPVLDGDGGNILYSVAGFFGWLIFILSLIAAIKQVLKNLKNGIDIHKEMRNPLLAGVLGFILTDISLMTTFGRGAASMVVRVLTKIVQILPF